MGEWIKDIEKLKNNDMQDYTSYYNGYKLLSMKGLNNIEPEIFICAGNRTGGKTFFFKRMLARMGILLGHKFLWVCRKKTQVKGTAASFYGDISNCQDLKGEWEIDAYITNVVSVKFDDEIIGYFTYLNFAADLKELSNMFNDVDCIVKDEFQSETNEYMPDEVTKIRSLHKSISRGYGNSVRYCALLLIGNQTSIVNPYYVALGIHKRLNKETHFLRGNGFVMEVFFNEEVANRSKLASFEIAFGEDDYSRSTNENIFLDNISFIERKDTSKMRPQFSIGKCNKWYSVWNGNYFYYVSEQPIKRGIKYALDLSSHTGENTIMMRRGDPIFTQLKTYFDKGRFYFENIESKSVCIEMFCMSIM